MARLLGHTHLSRGFLGFSQISPASERLIFGFSLFFFYPFWPSVFRILPSATRSTKAWPWTPSAAKPRQRQPDPAQVTTFVAAGGSCLTGDFLIWPKTNAVWLPEVAFTHRADLHLIHYPGWIQGGYLACIFRQGRDCRTTGGCSPFGLSFSLTFLFASLQ